MIYTLISFSVYCLLKLSSGQPGEQTAVKTSGEWIEAKWIEYPFMALVGGSCGGSIISLNGYNGNGVILTAAHCMVNDDGSLNELAKEIEIGCSKSDCGDDEGIKYIAGSLNPHPLYDPSLAQSDINFGNNDIGLIFLNEAISYPGSIKIDIENNLNVIKNNDELKGLGYGDTLEFEITHFMDTNECIDIWGDLVAGPHEFCVKDDIPDKYNKLTSSCSGDSGSPLIFKNKQIGLVSAGDSFCNPTAPSLVTSIPYYYNWIKSQCPGCVDSNRTPPRISTSKAKARPKTRSVSNTTTKTSEFNGEFVLNHRSSIQTQDCAYHAGTTLWWCWKACSNYIVDSSHWCWTGTRCGEDASICQRYTMECYYTNEEANC